MLSQSRIFRLQKKYKEALRVFEDFKSRDEDKFKFQFQYAQLFLLFANFREGWKRYEYRWKIEPLNKVVWPVKDRELWRAETSKKILIFKEQGIGDEIIFLGLIPEVIEKSEMVTVFVDKRLIALCRRSMLGARFIDDINMIKKDDFDYFLSIGSLPGLMRNDISDFDRTVTGYLKADPERVELLGRELGFKGKRIVGISWKSFKSLNQTKKSVDLKDFEQIFKDLDVTLLNLQYGDIDEELQKFSKETGIEVIQCSSVDNREDLDGLAALIELCDLVVSTSNVTIHMAGALGKETWVLLPYVANFWWLLDRTDSVWYPSLRLYRQKSLNDWESVFPLIRKDLQDKFG
jgi:ADP-heptose:LPS heptosyltransferase